MYPKAMSCLLNESVKNVNKKKSIARNKMLNVLSYTVVIVKE